MSPYEASKVIPVKSLPPTICCIQHEGGSEVGDAVKGTFQPLLNFILTCFFFKSCCLDEPSSGLRTETGS